MTRDCMPPTHGPKPGKPGPKSQAAKAGASTAHKAVARLKHEVRHERPMKDWGAKGAKR